MYYGLLALLTRALRMDARQMRNHLFRLAFVGFIYLCLLYATFTSAFFGAPGLSFFSQIAWLNVLFITCAGIGFFSSAITEEKEEDTIGLLQMAGLNHLGILLGKSTSRMIQVVLLLIVQFPFMLLSVTLGGVTTLQIVAAYVDLMAYTVLLANVGLLCSVLFRRGSRAAAFTTILMVIYGLAPRVATLELTSLKKMGWTNSTGWQSWLMTVLEWIEQSSVYTEIGLAMSTGFNKPIMNRQVISNCIAGMLCFFLSWLLFGPCVNTVDTRSDSRGMLLKSTGRIRLLSPGRCWTNPFVWKDFQFIGGGNFVLAVKLSCYIGILMAIAAIALTSGNWFGWSYTNVESVYLTTMLGILALEACVYASRIFHDEIRLHTMSSLMMLPRSIPYIGYSKLIGCVLGLVPAILCFSLALLFLPDTTTNRLFTGFLNPRIWAGVMTFLIFLHLITLLSLFIKWGALPAALFLMGPVSLCCPVGNLLIVFSNPTSFVPSIWGELPATVSIWILTGLVCFVFQMMIAARLQELGTK